jgi:hypothetical protein
MCVCDGTQLKDAMMRGECIPQSCSVFDGNELTEGMHRNGFLPFYT